MGNCAGGSASANGRGGGAAATTAAAASEAQRAPRDKEQEQEHQDEGEVESSVPVESVGSVGGKEKRFLASKGGSQLFNQNSMSKLRDDD